MTYCSGIPEKQNGHRVSELFFELVFHRRLDIAIDLLVAHLCSLKDGLRGFSLF